MTGTPANSTQALNTKLADIWDAEHAVRGEQVSMAFAPIGRPMHLRTAGVSNLQRAKDKLSALINALTPEEMLAYGAYRANELAEERQMVEEHDARLAARDAARAAARPWRA